MNFLYLSPHFPPNFQAFPRQLKQSGVNVLGLADVPWEALEPELQATLTEYYRVDDLHDYDALLAAARYFEHKYGPIDRIDSHAEYWLETEARLRTDLGIWGIQNDAIQAMKQKSRMKQRFIDAGIRVARGKVCKTRAEAEAFVAEVGLPVVAKPDNGVGAAATYKLKTPEDIALFFEDPPQTDYIVEEFISGELYSFDGLTDRDGNLKFYAANRFSDGIMETVLDNSQLSYYSLREIPADLDEAGKKVLKAFDVRERFFHFEFFRSHADGKLTALEVNMRPPGGLTTDMFNYANDIDIYHEWANLVANNRFSATCTRPYHVIYIARKRHLHYNLSHDEAIGRYGDLLCHYGDIPEAFSTVLGNTAYIARSPELQPLLDMAKEIQNVI